MIADFFEQLDGLGRFPGRQVDPGEMIHGDEGVGVKGSMDPGLFLANLFKEFDALGRSVGCRVGQAANHDRSQGVRMIGSKDPGLVVADLGEECDGFGYLPGVEIGVGKQAEREQRVGVFRPPFVTEQERRTFQVLDRLRVISQSVIDPANRSADLGLGFRMVLEGRAHFLRRPIQRGANLQVRIGLDIPIRLECAIGLSQDIVLHEGVHCLRDRCFVERIGRRLICRLAVFFGFGSSLLRNSALLGLDAQGSLGALLLPPGLDQPAGRTDDPAHQSQQHHGCRDHLRSVAADELLEPVEPAGRSGCYRFMGQETLEILGQGGGGVVTPIPLLGQGLQDDPVQLPAHEPAQPGRLRVPIPCDAEAGSGGVQPAARGWCLFLPNQAQHLIKGGILEPFACQRSGAGEQLVKDHSQGVDIHPGVDVEGVEPGLLGSHV